MLVIKSNRKGVTHLSVLVNKKPAHKMIAPGSNFIDDPAFEEAIQKDPDFKKWCEPGGIFGLEFKSEGKALTPKDGESANSYASVPEKIMKKAISESAKLSELEDIIAKDERPGVQKAARDRIEEIKKPEQKEN